MCSDVRLHQQSRWTGHGNIGFKVALKNKRRDRDFSAQDNETRNRPSEYFLFISCCLIVDLLGFMANWWTLYYLHIRRLSIRFSLGHPTVVKVWSHRSHNLRPRCVFLLRPVEFTLLSSTQYLWYHVDHDEDMESLCSHSDRLPFVVDNFAPPSPRGCRVHSQREQMYVISKYWFWIYHVDFTLTSSQHVPVHQRSSEQFVILPSAQSRQPMVERNWSICERRGESLELTSKWSAHGQVGGDILWHLLSCIMHALGTTRIWSLWS